MNSNKATTSDWDDYMSDAYTAVDIRPGIAKTETQRRNLMLEAKRVENIERLRNVPKHSEMEKKMRDDALAKPVSENSKGFMLLSKMGYKPGMSLGVEKKGLGCSEGIKVPIAIELKTNRTGLGHDAVEDEKRKQRMDLYQKAVLEKARTSEALIDDFAVRKRWAAHMKQLSKDLKESRKVCQELDARNGLELPVSSHFWPIYRVAKEDGVLESKKRKTEESECTTECFTYFNGKAAPEDLNIDELTKDEITKWLTELTGYLRAIHCYCIWCGAQYDSKEELENDCPGGTREEHEDCDEDS